MSKYSINVTEIWGTQRNARLELCTFVPWQSYDLSSVLKMQNSYRQEGLKTVEDDSKNEEARWLYHVFLGDE